METKTAPTQTGSPKGPAQEELSTDVRNVPRNSESRLAVALKEYGTSRAELERENFDLIAKVKEILTAHNLWGPDNTYTFNDGERWANLNFGDNDV
jgi:hypothetical protein